MARSRPSRKQNKSQSNNYSNQTGGDGSQGLQISDATLRQAGEIAQKLIGQSMKEGNVSQTGGSASGAAPSAAASAPASPQIHNAMVGGAVAGAVAGAAAAEAAESKSGLGVPAVTCLESWRTWRH